MSFKMSMLLFLGEQLVDEYLLMDFHTGLLVLCMVKSWRVWPEFGYNIYVLFVCYQ